MDILSAKWKARWLEQAKQVASYSKDESTQVGAIIKTLSGDPVSEGWNGMPPGVDEKPERHLRPTKYFFMEHAERNAIYGTDRYLDDCVMFVTHAPCADCARGIVRKRIKHVVVDLANGYDSDFAKARWDTCGFQYALEMFEESGITVHHFDLKAHNG